jgi:hypothetical protein
MVAKVNDMPGYILLTPPKGIYSNFVPLKSIQEFL